MIVNGNGKHALGMFLPDDIVVEHRVDVFRCRDAILGLGERTLVLFTDNVHAEFGHTHRK